MTSWAAWPPRAWGFFCTSSYSRLYVETKLMQQRITDFIIRVFCFFLFAKRSQDIQYVPILWPASRECICRILRLNPSQKTHNLSSRSRSSNHERRAGDINLVGWWNYSSSYPGVHRRSTLFFSLTQEFPWEEPVRLLHTEEGVQEAFS